MPHGNTHSAPPSHPAHPKGDHPPVAGGVDHPSRQGLFPAGTHHRNQGDSGPGPEGEDRPCRLNLLLSWGGWRPDSWADRMACLLEPMGVTSHRARTARQAEQVIRSTPVHIAVVDLGLPMEFGSPSDEAGPRILDILRRLESPPPTVVVRSPQSTRDLARELNAALRFDAFAVVDRRSADVEFMLRVLQRCLERFYHGRWPHESGGCTPAAAPQKPRHAGPRFWPFTSPN